MEANNAQELREALLCILDIAARDMPNYCRSRARDQGESESIRAWSNTIVELAKNALSKPARQCDIGTAEEQIDRHNRHCQYLKDTAARYNFDLAICDDCRYCFAKWAQMPFEKGNTK